MLFVSYQFSYIGTNKKPDYISREFIFFIVPVGAGASHIHFLECKDNQLVIISVISAILMQVLMHCSINCVIIPTTGLTMPLISYGGSSLVGTFLLLGLALSFCKQMDSTGE